MSSWTFSGCSNSGPRRRDHIVCIWERCETWSEGRRWYSIVSKMVMTRSSIPHALFTRWWCHSFHWEVGCTIPPLESGQAYGYGSTSAIILVLKLSQIWQVGALQVASHVIVTCFNHFFFPGHFLPFSYRLFPARLVATLPQSLTQLFLQGGVVPFSSHCFCATGAHVR